MGTWRMETATQKIIPGGHTPMAPFLFNAAEAATYEIKHICLEKLPLRESDNLLCDPGVTLHSHLGLQLSQLCVPLVFCRLRKSLLFSTVSC